MSYYNTNPEILKKSLEELSRQNEQLRKKVQELGGVEKDDELRALLDQFESISKKILEFGEENIPGVEDSDKHRKISEIFYGMEMAMDEFLNRTALRMKTLLKLDSNPRNKQKFRNFVHYYYALCQSEETKEFVKKNEEIPSEVKSKFTELLEKDGVLFVMMQIFLLECRFDPSDRSKIGEPFDDSKYEAAINESPNISSVLRPSLLDGENREKIALRGLVCCEKVKRRKIMMGMDDDDDEEETEGEGGMKRISRSDVDEMSESLDPTKLMERLGATSVGGGGRSARIGAAAPKAKKRKKSSFVANLALGRVQGRGRGGNRMASSMMIASDYNERLHAALDIKKKEAAVSIKTEQLSRKEEKLKEKEEELKRREEALSIFEEELKGHRRMSVLQIENIRKQVGKRTEEARKEIEKVAKRRKKRRKVKKKVIKIKKVKKKSKKPKKSKKDKDNRPAPVKNMTIPKIDLSAPVEEISEKERDSLEFEIDLNFDEEEGVGDVESPYKLTTLVEEFLQIDHQFTDVNNRHFSIALKSGNKEKNRYNDVLPYNHNVILMKGNYINASDCKINNIPYIACQWPLKKGRMNGDLDFWSMVYYNKVRVVVNLQEPKPPKHHYYWPPRNNIMKLKKYTIRGVDIIKGPVYDIYKCILEKKLIRKKLMGTLKKGMSIKGKKGPKDHEVYIMVYKKWPDHGIPEEYTSLFQLITKTDKLNMQGMVDGVEPSIVVHCSAGIGRSGVFILAHNILRNNWNTQQIAETLYKMRKERHGMIQTPAQYKYAYDFIWKYTEKDNFFNKNKNL